MVSTILVLAANPYDQGRLKLKAEYNAIKDGIHRFNDGQQFKVEHVWETQALDIHRAIDEYQPQILHFCGHGSKSQGFMLMDEFGKSQPVRGDALAMLFDERVQRHLECVVLNTCYSDSQVNEIKQHIDYVVGVKDSVPDETAIHFSVGFYEALSTGRSFEESFNRSLGVVEVAGACRQHFTLKKKNSLGRVKMNSLI